MSFEYIDNNHASDYDVECYVGLQLMSDFEIECYKQESEDLLRQNSTGK